jgi:hypothetical protein
VRGGKFVQKGSLMPYLEHEKNVHFTSFPQAFVKKQCKHVRVSLCPIGPLEDIIQNTIEGIKNSWQIATSMGFCTNLSNKKCNALFMS